ncbi:MAG: aminotransferase class V-fold PLP-dependent enzyme [Opitutales bacterium]|nr:aminotransferase class V-fold PLP-dependent enzyme [Opitutales bacterium]
MIYFDYNATAPLVEEAKQAWNKAYEESWVNPGSPHQASVEVRAKFERCRERVAELLMCAPEELVFLSGATEVCNAWMRSFAKSGEKKILVSKQEHAAMHESAQEYLGDRVVWFSPVAENLIEVLSEKLHADPEIGAISMMAANNETGMVFPWQEVAILCRERGIPFYCDTCQWIGKQPLAGLEELDFFCTSAHKFGAPKGVGLMKVSGRFGTTKSFVGGSQEHSLRAGTQDYANVAALSAALEVAISRTTTENINTRLKWRDEFVEKLSQRLPQAVVHGRGKACLWNTVFVALPGRQKAIDWVDALWKEGFAVGFGSACSTAKNKTSRVLEDLGVDPEIASRSIRISAGWDRSKFDWEALLEVILKIHQKFSEDQTDSLTEVVSID